MENKDSLQPSKLQIEQRLSFIKNNFNKMYFNEVYRNKRKYFYIKILDSLVLSYNKVDGKILGDYYIENVKKNTSFRLAKSDSLTTYSHRTIEVEENSSNNSDLIVDKNDTKIIKGYKCFKVIFKEEEILFDEILKIDTRYSMYVKDKIKLQYHPVFKNKFI